MSAPSQLNEIINLLIGAGSFLVTAFILAACVILWRFHRGWASLLMVVGEAVGLVSALFWSFGIRFIQRNPDLDLNGPIIKGMQGFGFLGHLMFAIGLLNVAFAYGSLLHRARAAELERDSMGR
ncbi:MAG: hypothetical protein R3F11_02360 [Verrucomicrobiales bacterium]